MAALAAFSLLLIGAGCAGITSAKSTESTTGSVSVSLAPDAVHLQVNATQQFSATLSGSSDATVTWSATGGAVSTSGLYTAPATPGTFTVTATSSADSTKSASATVTVTSSPPAVSVSITPGTASVNSGGSLQFSTTVSGTSNTAVTWTATGGTISTSGLYTAPSAAGTYTVRATSVADSSKSASATVIVNTAGSSTYLLTASPASVNFGSVLVGSSLVRTVTLSNTGDSSVTLSAANFTGGVFGASLSLPLTIAAGATQSVSIIFAPDISGPFSGTVSFVSTATNSPATITLSGTGTATQSHSVDLTWVGSTTSGVVGYFAYRGPASGGPYTKLNTTPEPTTTYTDNTVQSGLTYYYVVTAVDGTGAESGYSNESVATIPSP